jgi:ABC-type microcin C transport system permease subunit YejE
MLVSRIGVLIGAVVGIVAGIVGGLFALFVLTLVAVWVTQGILVAMDAIDREAEDEG